MKRIFAMTGLLVFAHISAASGQSAIGTDYQADQSSSGYLRLGLGTGRSNASAGGGSTSGDWGFGLDAAAGVTFGDRVRWDVVDIGYHSFNFTESVYGGPAQGKATRLDLMTNLWIGDFTKGRLFRPYFGGGVGSGRFDDAGDVYWGFAWNAGAGFEFQLTSSLAIGPRYVFRQVMPDVPGPGGVALIGATINTHELMVTLVWSN